MRNYLQENEREYHKKEISAGGKDEEMVAINVYM